MSRLLEILPVLLGLISVTVGAFTFWSSLIALRAKERLRAKLREHGAAMASKTVAAKSEIEMARQLIEEASETLSEQDKELVKKGLHQKSKSGEQRYIADLLSA